jgi:hypothetical protein
MKSEIFCIVLSFLATIDILYAQQPVVSRFIILTVEDKWSKNYEGTYRYYWICEYDSIRGLSHSEFHPFFLSAFSKSNLDDCCNGIAIDPFTVTQSDSVYEMEKKYYAELDNLKLLIKTGRKKTQEIVKKWSSTKNTQFITFFITPIKGRFCITEISKNGQSRTGYKGKVFIPYSSFELDNGFWNTPKSSFLLNHDFYSLRYNSVSPP